MYQNSYVSAIEKGLDGSDQTISFIDNNLCNIEGGLSFIENLSKISAKFNNRTRDFIGEQILKPKTICIPRQTDFKDIRVVIKDLKKNKVDTLGVSQLSHISPSKR
jgi:hypothetical protein